MNPGDVLLFFSLAVGLSTVGLLLFEQMKNKEIKLIKWLIRVFTAVLFLDFSLLLYYFYVSDFTIDYVWSFSSKYYPIYYKLSGALAGQEGTLLFWALLIALGSVWLNEGRDSASDFVRKAQLLVMSLGTYFVALTLVDSPFRTIYEAYPELSKDVIPIDGSGLNPLLLDPWMAAHPFTMFIGYAGVTVPFAGAMIYLLKSLRGDSMELHRQWISKTSQWCRVAWLFLTIAIAFGGIWSYKVLGWGGFWAWDPIETASLIPWLMLTGAMHALAEHRKDREKYSILAPVLVSMSFALVIYATLVTRSGVFESVHAFVAGGAGPYLILLSIVSFAAPILLGVLKYLKIEERKQRPVSNLINKTNIFYLAILSLVALTFVSFFGITYPALIKMLTGNKYGVGISFFNIWSYPVFIFLMLLVGIGLTYTQARKKEVVREFTFFTALTVAAAFLRPGEGWNIVNYSAIIGPQKPFFYSIISSASALSFLPPSTYILYGVLRRGTEVKKKRDFGTLTIHLGIVFIIIGAVFSTMFTSELSGTLDVRDRENIFPASPATLHQWIGAWGVHEGEGTTPYGVRLLDFKEKADYKKDWLHGKSVAEFYQTNEPMETGGSVVVYGVAKDFGTHQNFTLFSLNDDGASLRVVSKEPVPQSDFLIVAGYPYFPEENGAHEMLLIAENIADARDALNKVTQTASIEVFSNRKVIGSGTAKLEKYDNNDVRRVMIDRSPLRDVYVIFSGLDGDRLTLTIKLVPLVNFIWFGIALFVTGIVVILLSQGNAMGRRK